MKLKDGVSQIKESNPISKDLHGDDFYYTFDAAFGLIYLELKELSGAMLRTK